MFNSIHFPQVLAVFPVLVGPLQTLLALLPAILVSVASMALAIFRPGGFVKLVRFCWRQKLFFGSVAILVFVWQNLSHLQLMARPTSGNQPDLTTADWNAARGGPFRQGRGPGADDATVAGTVWSNLRDKTILASPAITGDLVIFSTATDIGPFSPEGRGAIVCVNAHSGKEVWRYAPDRYRATFSSPVVSGGLVICGEGLHQVEDARVTCLDLNTGDKLWDFRTQSHVESTPAIADGCVYFGAGSDGFYCLWTDPNLQGKSRIRWHLPAASFADCESSPVIEHGLVYFGLGEEGTAVCAVRAETGELAWKLDTPYPVFAPPTVARGKLFIATGNGNYVQSASDLLEMKLQLLRDDDASEQQLAEACARFKPTGEVWCIDLASKSVEWKFVTADAVLGAIAYTSSTNGLADEIAFASRDGHLYRVSIRGELLAKYDLHEPLISSPAIGGRHVYCTTASGRLICHERVTLKPVWDCSLGKGATFTSSPTLAHGHIYVGTAESGMTCIGRPGQPEPPKWTGSHPSGGPQDAALLKDLHKRWEYPSSDAKDFVVTAPLMPFAGAVYAAGLRQTRSELVKLNLEATESEQRESWVRQFQEPIAASPIGYGDQICVLEGTNRLHCLAAADGTTRWIRSLGGGDADQTSVKDAPVIGMTLSATHVFAWTTQRALGCFELSTGQSIWEQPVGISDSTSAASGWGTPVFDSDLVIAIRRRDRKDHSEPAPVAILTAQDALTGVQLWHIETVALPAGSPVIDGHEVFIPLHDRQVAVYGIVDGRFIRTQTSQQTTTPVPGDEPGIAQIFALGRHVFTVNDSGGIVCWGAAAP